MLIVIYDVLKLLILFTLLLIAEAGNLFDKPTSSSRKLSYYYNPGCETPEYESLCSNETQLNLMHIRADSSEDTLHFLWSTWKLPTVIIARTSHNTSLYVNWTELSNLGNDAIVFSERPSYSIGLLIKEVWEFTDEKDDVDISRNLNSTKPLNLTSLDWGDVNATVKLTEGLITAFPRSSNKESAFLNNGSFAVKFSASSEQTASTDFPHLVFTGNSTQIQFILDNLVTEDKKSRFAIECVAFSSHGAYEEWDVLRDKSISDEFSPGVFRFLELKAPCESNQYECKGVLSWKPVSYIGQKATVANSSDAVMSPFGNTSSFPALESITACYFASYPNISQAWWNVTFGASGDGFYSKTRYTSWSLMMGTGDAVSQGLSRTAILVIAIGLGVPLVLMVIATIYLGVTQCRRKDDELLLSEDSMN